MQDLQTVAVKRPSIMRHENKRYTTLVINLVVIIFNPQDCTNLNDKILTVSNRLCIAQECGSRNGQRPEMPSSSNAFHNATALHNWTVYK